MSENNGTRLTRESKLGMLREKVALMGEQNSFEVGDVVDWKPGLKNRKSVGPFLVTRVLETPVDDGAKESGSQYFLEPLDIVLARIDDRDENYDLDEYHFDSRRFVVVK